MTTRPRGPQPNWRPRTARQKALLADIVARYQKHYDEDTLPRGGRGIFYDLRPAGRGNGVTYTKPTKDYPVKDFGPMEASPDAVQEVLALARRAGMMPESWVADAHAPTPITQTIYADADDFASTVAEAAEEFLLDAQRDQDLYIEVWCEAEGLAPRLARIALPYGVHVYSGGGYDGLKGKRSFAARAADRDVPTIVFGVSDRDDHGDKIFRACAEDSSAWVTAYTPGLPGDWLTFRRLALTREQAEAHGVLDEDGKAEADALSVPIMDGILREALDELLDPEIRQAVLAEQDDERRRLPEVVRATLLGSDQ
jgi:hypothetical protein